MMAAAKSVTAKVVRDYASTIADDARREQVEKDALDIDLKVIEIGAQAKARLLAFAERNVLESFSQWDQKPVGNSLDQQRALLRAFNTVRGELGSENIPEALGAGLLFGWRSEDVPGGVEVP